MERKTKKKDKDENKKGKREKIKIKETQWENGAKRNCKRRKQMREKERKKPK